MQNSAHHLFCLFITMYRYHYAKMRCHTIAVQYNYRSRIIPKIPDPLVGRGGGGKPPTLSKTILVLQQNILITINKIAHK